MPICASGRHRWRHDQCMVCSVCGECTGYGSVCVSSGRPDRNMGTFCGCGSGDSGCAECGACRTCAGEEGGLIQAAAISAAAATAENNPASGVLPLPASSALGPAALAGTGPGNEANDAVRDFYRLNLLATGGSGAQNIQGFAGGQDLPKFPAHHPVYREKFIRRRLQKMGNCRRSRRYTEKEKDDSNWRNGKR